jgi:hemerythrin
MAIAGGLFLWGHHYLTGINEIDHQHEEITLLLNQLHEARRNKASDAAQRALLNSLISLVGEHFRTEESYMRELGYEELELHKLEHDAFAGKVMELRAEFERGQDQVLEGGLEFVKEWLRDHMMTSDRRMGRFLSRRLGID